MRKKVESSGRTSLVKQTRTSDLDWPLFFENSLNKILRVFEILLSNSWMK